MSAVAGRRVSDDLRYELIDAARVAETGNRPRALLILATLLFLAAGVALIVAIQRRDSAARDFRTHSERKALMENLQVQASAIEAQRQSPAAEIGRPLVDLMSRIEDAATEAGLSSKPGIPERRSPREGGAIKNQYTYTLREPSLEPLLGWLERAREKVPGLEVGGLEVVPEAKMWKFTVTFVRWERAS